jgi:hypothetical protein
MGRVGVLLVHLGRGEIVDQAVHAFAAGVLERIVELVAGLAVVLYAGAAVVVVADGQQFVDGRQIPAFALVAAPFESREIVPRKVVRSDILRHLLHVRHPVGAVVGARKAQVRLAELAPVKVDFIERYDQSVLAVVRKLADHSPDAVLVVEFADFVLFEHVPASGNRLHGRRFRDSRSGRGGWNSRSGRSQRRRGNGFGVILLFAVGILDVMDLRNGEHVGRTVGIRKTLVTHRFGRDFDHFGFDFRGVGLDDQVLRGGRQGAAQRCERQQNGSFHHYQYRYIRQI